jgi:hypothetical protein
MSVGSDIVVSSRPFCLLHFVLHAIKSVFPSKYLRIHLLTFPKVPLSLVVDGTKEKETNSCMVVHHDDVR